MANKNFNWNKRLSNDDNVDDFEGHDEPIWESFKKNINKEPENNDIGNSSNYNTDIDQNNKLEHIKNIIENEDPDKEDKFSQNLVDNSQEINVSELSETKFESLSLDDNTSSDPIIDDSINIDSNDNNDQKETNHNDIDLNKDVNIDSDNNDNKNNINFEELSVDENADSDVSNSQEENEEIALPDIELEQKGNDNSNAISDNKKEDNDPEIDLDSLIRDSIKSGSIIKSGNYYSIMDIDDLRLHGMKNMKKYLEENNDIIDHIRNLNNSATVNASFVNNQANNSYNYSQNNENNGDNFNFNHSDELTVQEEILEYVCKQTIKHLLDSYKSEMYTEKYTSNLFEKYLNDEIDFRNPLFRELISECLNSNVVDAYLGKDLTKVVLNYIMNN